MHMPLIIYNLATILVYLLYWPLVTKNLEEPMVSNCACYMCNSGISVNILYTGALYIESSIEY